jgi:hypothetical protein
MAWLRKAVAVLWGVIQGILYVAFALTCAAGLYSAGTAEGYTDDRSAELRRLRDEVSRERAACEELQARVEAMGVRPDVQIQSIRSELNYVLPGEQIRRFK